MSLQVFRRPLVFNHLLCFREIRKKEIFELKFAFLEYFSKYDNFYCTAPYIWSIKLEKNKPKYYRCQYFMAFIMPVDFELSEGYCFLDKFELKDAFMTRVASDETDYFKIDQQFRQLIEGKFKEKISDETYFVVTELYDQMVHDIYIPIIGEGAEG